MRSSVDMRSPGIGDHHGDVAAGGVAAHRQRDALRLLGARRGHELGAQRLDRRLEQLVARERLEGRDRRLVVVRALDQALGLDDRLQLAAQERRARGLLEVDERREQADHAQEARERAVGPQDAHGDVVHARAPVHARAAVGLADHEQVAARRRGARAGTRAARRRPSAAAKRELPSSRRMPSPEPASTCTVGPAGPLGHVVDAGAEQDEVARRAATRGTPRSPRPRRRRARRRRPRTAAAMRSTIACMAAKSPTASCSSPSASRTAADERLALVRRRAAARAPDA